MRFFPIRRKTVNDLGANTDRAQNGNRPRYRIKLEKRTYQMLGIFNRQICNRSGNNQQDQSENNLFAQRIIRIKKKSRFKRSRIRSGQMVLYPFLTQQSTNCQKQKNTPCSNPVLVIITNNKQHSDKQNISYMGNILNQFPFNRTFSTFSGNP